MISRRTLLGWFALAATAPIMPKGCRHKEVSALPVPDPALTDAICNDLMVKAHERIAYAYVDGRALYQLAGLDSTLAAYPIIKGKDPKPFVGDYIANPKAT